MRLLTLILLFAVGIQTQGWSQNLPNPKVEELVYSPANVFLPQGFDDNDNAQVVIHGYYPNTCYRSGRARVRVDKVNNNVIVEDTALYYPDMMCLQIIVPYTKTLDVGLLNATNYHVLTASANDYEVRGDLPVSKSSTAKPDNFVYAPISEVEIKYDRKNSKANVTLKGVFKNTCLEIKEVKVLKTKQDVIEVLPVLKADSGPDCKKTEKSFNYTFTLDNKDGEKMLLHIRSMSGNSVNRIIN